MPLHGVSLCHDTPTGKTRAVFTLVLLRAFTGQSRVTCTAGQARPAASAWGGSQGAALHAGQTAIQRPMPPRWVAFPNESNKTIPRDDCRCARHPLCRVQGPADARAQAHRRLTPPTYVAHQTTPHFRLDGRRQEERGRSTPWAFVTTPSGSRSAITPLPATRLPSWSRTSSSK